MPLLHVLGAGPWQVPTIRLAKSIGLRVLVTDYYESRPGYEYADIHEVVDITDLRATLDVARHYGVSGIICDTTDVGVPTAAYVAEHMGLPGMPYEVALNFTNKKRMREIARQCGISTPTFVSVNCENDCKSIAIGIDLPVIVKPVDSQSGKGVTRVTSGEQIPNAVRYAIDNSKTKTAIIEELIVGQEIIVDSFMLDGQSVILGIAEKTPHKLEPTVSERITYRPLHEYKELPLIQRINQTLLSAMGLHWGIAHAEYILHDGEITPIDIAARGGGCMIYTHILPYISAVDANLEMIKLAVGNRPTIAPSKPKAGNIEFFHIGEGLIESWHGLEDAFNTKGVLGIHFNMGPGDMVPRLKNKDQRAGYIVAGATNTIEAISASLTAKSKISARMRGYEQNIPVM